MGKGYLFILSPVGHIDPRDRIHLPFFKKKLSIVHSETNLKIKQALPETVHLITPLEVSQLGGLIRSEQPNNSLYTFEGTLLMNSAHGNSKEVPLDPTQVLLRV